ncbi:hypothetical protein [Psychrobacter sp. JCM 18903]|uniref:hypothetical protein n=1 Tax=Psychrobacter sp. JCM 18903 TaxID=1298610 RepID=UPI0004BC78DE|nr:hypothetical protein [Psychrobacter sp. JCM 18903]
MTDNLTIYKQIYPSQCTKISELGYRSVLNIRPDAETETQPIAVILPVRRQKPTLLIIIYRLMMSA